MELLFRRRKKIQTDKLVAINTLTGEGRPQFIHSATYEQLIRRFGLSGEQIAKRIRACLGS